MYHSIPWTRTLSKNLQVPLYFTWHRKGDCVGYAIGRKQWSHTPIIGKLLKKITFESYPVVAGNSTQLMEQIVGQLLDYSIQHKYMSITLNSFLTDCQLKQHSQHFTVARRIEFSIDLSLSDDELVKNMATRQKRKIKKAQKHELIFREAETMEAMRDFRKLQLRSRERRVNRGEKIGSLDDSYYEELGKNYFREHLGRVFFLTKDDRPVSAAFVTIYGHTAYYTYGGSSDDGFSMDAPPLLFLNIFKRCRELGCSVFNLGGVPASSTDVNEKSHGLYLFKAGFGGREIQCSSLSVEALQPGLDKLVTYTRRILGRKNG